MWVAECALIHVLWVQLPWMTAFRSSVTSVLLAAYARSSAPTMQLLWFGKECEQGGLFCLEEMVQVLPDKVQARGAAEDAAWDKAADRDGWVDSVPGSVENVFARNAARESHMNAVYPAIRSIAPIVGFR